MISPENKNRIIKTLYLITFLTSAHYAFIVYINSSYLSVFVSKENLGILYVLASIVSILTISRIPKILRYLGQFKTAITVLTLDMLAVLTMAWTASPFLKNTTTFTLSDGVVSVENINKLVEWLPAIAIISFIMFQVSIVLNRIVLDTYLEEFSKNSETGNNRGFFLASVNLAFVLSPFIVGKIATGASDGFWKVYLISAGFILLSLAIISTKLRHVKDVNYHSPPISETVAKIYRNKNIFNIYISSFMLEFFYSWMVIYTPIYLHEVVGLNWERIGIIFSIMLTSFVILQIPLGKLADKYLGEKEILTAGFIIMALSTGILTFINTNSLMVWAIALFMTRVGASAVEVMNDTYFFKKVKPTDSDVISFFRNASPIAYIVGPTLASGALYFVDYKYLFLILGAITLSGTIFSLRIKDTL